MVRTSRRLLCLVSLAVMVVVAASATSASAKLPEIGRCEATESGSGGRYTDANCVEKAKLHKGTYTGKYEWHPLSNQLNVEGIELEGGPMTFETASGVRVECPVADQFDETTFTGPKSTHTPYWTFFECHPGESSEECHSALFIEPGEITNNYAWHEEAEEEGEPVPGWVGELGYVSRGSEPTVGMQYTVKNDERLFPPISCLGGIETLWIGGGQRGGDAFISTYAPLDTMTRSLTETFSESAPGIAAPTKLSGHKAVYLQAFRENHWERVAISGTWSEYVGGRGIEIKAVP